MEKPQAGETEDTSLTDAMRDAMERDNGSQEREPKLSFADRAAVEMDDINKMRGGRRRNERIDELFMRMQDKIRELESRTETLKRMQDKIRELESRTETLKRVGEMDPLTKVLNRRGFEKEVLGDPDDPYHKGTLEKFREEKASAHERDGEESWDKEYVIYMLDIDHFKQFNDTYGHEWGDAALKLFAEAIAEFVRDEDVVGRWGGEEFIIQMVTKNRGDRNAVGTRLLEAIRKLRLNINGRQIPITASIGMAKLKDGEEFDSLVSRADQGLYKAKNAGRNTLSIPDDEE